MFIIGNKYNRRRDLHNIYGGNPQSGISKCANFPIIFIFTSPLGRIHGYDDKWVTQEVYQYTGEGQFGNMELMRGNRAIRYHESIGYKIHLFSKTLPGEYEYIGEFRYLKHIFVSGNDTDQRMRNMIVFQLEKVEF
jgi:5-methylcytosine-specific restriction protein A